jgi:hypothetical protein
MHTRWDRHARADRRGRSSARRRAAAAAAVVVAAGALSLAAGPVHASAAGGPIQAGAKSSKVFINDSSVDLRVTIFVRKGADPADGNSSVKSFSLAAGGQESVAYGSSTNIYINGLAFTANEGQQQTAESSHVLIRGGTWDNVLNTNNTITFTAADIDDVVGSNT